jgi:hypothetical protein
LVIALFCSTALLAPAAFAQSERWTIYQDTATPVEFGVVEGKTRVEVSTQKGDTYFEAQLVSRAHFRSIFASVDLSKEGFSVYQPERVPLLTVFVYETPEGLAEAAGPPKGKDFDVNLVGKGAKCAWRDGRLNGLPALAGEKGLYDVFILLAPGSYPYVMRARSQYEPGWKDPRFIARRNHYLAGVLRRFRWRKAIPPAEIGKWREHILKTLGCGA